MQGVDYLVFSERSFWGCLYLSCYHPDAMAGGASQARRDVMGKAVSISEPAWPLSHFFAALPRSPETGAYLRFGVSQPPPWSTRAGS